mgnify:CR=1 FL=1
MDERGRLSFKENESIKGDKKLNKVKKHWESFAENEEGERDKYLRELEIQFSMNEFVEGEGVAAPTMMASMLAEKKTDEQEFDAREKIEEE